MNILKKTMVFSIYNLYLVFTSTDGNKKVLAKFTKLWDEIEHLVETINKGKKGEYVNKLLKLHMLTVILRYVFEEDRKYYPQAF